MPRPQSFQSANILLQVASESRIAVFAVDPAGDWAHLCPTWEELTGWTVGETLGRPMRRFIHPADHRALDDALADVTAGRKPVRLLDLRVEFRSGAHGWVQARLMADHAADGQCGSVIGTLVDAAQIAIARRDAGDALRRSDERHALAVWAAQVGIWDIDLLRRTVYWSPLHKTIFGLGDDEEPIFAAPDSAPGLDGLGRTLERILHPDDLPRVQQAYTAHLERGTPYDVEFRIRHRTGAVRRVRAQAEAIRDESGRPVRITGSVMDVTERVEATSWLRHSEQRFYDFADAASDWLWEMDANLRFTYFSDRIISILGVRPLDVLGKTRTEIADENVRDPKWRNHLADLQAHRPFRDFEYAHRRADGEVQYFRISGKPVFSEAGAFLGYRGTGTNITEQRLAEMALRETQARAKLAEQRLADAVENMSEGFVMFDADRRFIMCNGRYREFYPALADLLVPGTPLRDLILRLNAAEGYVPPEGLDALLAARLAPDLTHYATDQHMASGRWIRISDHRTSDGGMVGIRTDITLLKEQEQALRTAKEAAERASRAKSAFLASMSHELRTPLNAIIGFSDVLKAELAEVAGQPAHAEYLDDIHHSGQHLLGLINDILDVARFEAGRLDLNEDMVDLRKVIAEAARVAQSAFAAGKHRLDLDLPHPPPVLRADLRRLKQVMINLLGNALKFTSDGGAVGVRVRVGETVSIAVNDTGIGIEPDRLADIGQAFVQIDDAKSRRYPGSGLGLHISKALVERHGGTLDIESQPGIGTTVTVRLPRERLVGTAAPAGAPPLR